MIFSMEKNIRNTCVLSELIENVDRHLTAIKMERSVHNPEKQEMDQGEMESQKDEQLFTYRTADNQKPTLQVQTKHLQSIKDIIEQKDNRFYGLINNVTPDSEQIVQKSKGRPTHGADVQLEQHEQRDKRKSLKQQLSKTAANHKKGKSALSTSAEMER